MINLNLAKDILGMNARNFEYIGRYNSNSNKKFADDKIFTKQFLESRGIGVAKLFFVVSRYTELTKIFFQNLPESFVVKPNKGFAGGGILVISRKKGNSWYTISGKKISNEDLFRHCADILDGKYSISGTTDKIIFEELLEPHSDFRKITNSGLPDIRVIVFNKVPILAMLRVPTEESDGKANMELGALGMGIDIGTGKTTGVAYHSSFSRKLPNGELASNFQIPFWDEILYASSKIQIVTNIGYLGVDFVIAKNGIKVLELNARSGLKIQIANQIPQKPRLKKVSDLKIITAEEGVEVAKTLFSRKIYSNENKIDRPVIGIEQDVVLNTDPPKHILAKIDLLSTENKISPRFYQEKALLDITIEGKRLKLPVKKNISDNSDLILAGKFLEDFYIDPKKKTTSSPKNLTSHVDKQKIENLDKKICEIDEKIKLLSFINPQNTEEQKELFFVHKNYSPIFSYRNISVDLDFLSRDLKKLPIIDHPLIDIFINKKSELELKIQLLKSRESKDFTNFSNKLFGKVSKKEYLLALDFLQKHQTNKPDESLELNSKQAEEVVIEFLKKNKLKHWMVKFVENSVAEMQVVKSGSILIKKSAKFTENRLKALLVHEIGTHVFRNENGKNQPFKIFERGTANYLETEEGIAVYNQNRLGLELGEKFLVPALTIVTIYMAEKLGFCDLFNWLKDTFNISDKEAWKRCIKVKRGFYNTKEKGAFSKDAIYFRGNLAVEKFIKKGGKLEDLYIGKISIDDLKVLKNFEEIVPPKFLPKFEVLNILS